MPIELKDLLSFLFQRADAMQTFWNFYAGAVTAVLGVVTAGKSDWLNRWVSAALTAARQAVGAAASDASRSLTAPDRPRALAGEASR